MIKLFTNILQQKKWLLIGLLLCFSIIAEASHFRYGNITWRVVSGRTVEFTVTTAWRSGAVGSANLNFNGAPISGYQQLSNTIVSNVNGVGTRVQRIRATYSTNGPHRVSYSTCCRIGGLANSGAYWDIFTIVNLNNGNQNSPVSSLPAIVNLPENSTAATFQVPANDLDGDALTYRLATASELRGSLPPGMSINPQTGVITVNTNLPNYSRGQKWYAGVVISDSKGASTLIDFLMEITAPSSPPVFIYPPTPPNGTVFQLAPGQPITFQVRARDNDPGNTISSLFATGLPAGASFSPASGNPATTSFSWIPTSSDFGSKVLNFVAQDNVGVQASTSVTIQVSLKPRFDIPPTPATADHIVVEPGQTISYTVRASDPDPTDVVTINNVKGKDMNGNEIALYNGASLSPFPTSPGNPTSGTFSWTTQSSDWGHKHVYFFAEDSYGDVTKHEVSQLINTTPVFTSTPATSVTVGNQYTYNISVADPDQTYGDVVNIYATSKPTWLTFTDNGNGVATLTGTPQLSDAGSYSIELEAQDINHHQNVGGIPRQQFTLIVNPCNLSLSVSSVQDETCADATDGAIVVDLQGANDPVTYSWSNGATTKDISGLDAGTYTLNVEDAFGCTETVSATVSTVDNIPPAVVVQNINVPLDANGNATITPEQIDNGSSDACGIASLALDETSFSCDDIGENTVTLTVTDVNGNISTATASVTVVDNIAPTVVAQDITVQLDATGNATIELADVDNGSSDACGIATSTIDIANFNCANVGTNTVTLTVTDVNGNTASATATVTVEDNVAPTALAQDVTIQLDANGNASITAADVDNGSSDACGIASLALDISSFDCSNVGANTVTLTVTDNNGNASTATATVTVEDNVAPVAVAQDLTIQLDAGGNAAITAAEVDNGSSDACGIASLALDISSFDCSNVGANTVTLTVTDNNGNTSTATSTVTVEDNVAPVAVAQDLTIQLDAAGNVAITAADVDNGSSDACGIASLTLDISSFDCSNVGANTVTLTVTDNNGNMSAATAQVTIEDNIAPTVLTSSIVIQLDASGQASITVPDIDNGSSDACGIASMSLSQTDFNCNHVGANSVALTVVDVNGNSSSADATVTVEDNVVPSVLTTNLTIALDENGTAVISEDDINNGSSDACGISSLSLDQTSFDCSHVGENIVTLTVIDVHGNEASATAAVQVTNDLPEITSLSLPVDPVEINELVMLSATFSDVNLVSASIDWGDGTQSPGIISGGSIEASHVYPGSDLYTVSLTITDICGETDTEIFQYVIVSSTNDGEVKGDGYVWSNIGNYLYNPTVEGKAKYKFDVKYKKKKVYSEKEEEEDKKSKKSDKKKGKDYEYVYVLYGKAEFKFKDAKLEFKSEEYDWLVVNEQMAVLKGSGKLNKISGYEFIISAIESESKKKYDDKFRIKIWSTDNGTVVYDNLMGTDIDSEAIPTILKGKIDIKRPKKDKKGKKDKDEDDDNARLASENSLDIELFDSAVDAYPNPFRDVFYIKHTGELVNKDVELTMRDVSGRIIYTKSYNPYFEPEVNIDFEGKPIQQGIYLVHLNAGDSSKTIRLIKK